MHKSSQASSLTGTMDFDLRKVIIQASSFQKQRVKNRGLMMSLIMKPLRRLSDAKNLQASSCRRYIRGSNPMGWSPNETNFLANSPATSPDPAFDLMYFLWKRRQI